MRGRRGSRLAWVLVLAGTVARAATQAAITPVEASRFLAQATLGADWEEIHRTARIGPEAWIEEQFARPIGRHEPALAERRRLGLAVNSEHRRWSWWKQVMDGPDPLRQRIALALSEIFVVSDNLDAIDGNPEGLANYYDMLLANAFGNYRDLLHDVTLHPIMGTYLSHLRNEKSDPRIGRFPDENYAREVMQLFSIGLYRLHPDGTFVQDGAGRPIPTYDNGDIRVKVDPWSARIELMSSHRVALLSAREKMPFQVTPLMPYLARFGARSGRVAEEAARASKNEARGSQEDAPAAADPRRPPAR